VLAPQGRYVHVVTEGNGRKGRIGRHQHRPGQQQALAGELAVDGGDVAVLRPVIVT